MKTVQTIQGVPFQFHIYTVMIYQQMSTFHLRNAGPLTSITLLVKVNLYLKLVDKSIMKRKELPSMTKECFLPYEKNPDYFLFSIFTEIEYLSNQVYALRHWSSIPRNVLISTL